ncbi:S-layer homology domain-containing protein [Merismopedia glauca]|uniref:S-layer protein n=1 Tax=Merismopedia glauca CCAP 1448/3 TaxID=1296344 RepID=A0A2T1C2W0_9CYAN|nr:S-layer homology domain-containing protein [Merismopedia glauca]PSB02592.1 S-layer protein [Merismopedia glauca CCAP 1448/3]
MNSINIRRSGTALLMGLGLTVTSLTPTVSLLTASSPVVAQTNSFKDVSNDYWAKDFITALAANGIIKGFPDNTFKPEEPVTRAQFAAMVRNAFDRTGGRQAISFGDVPSNYWAKSAIEKSYEMGFLSGYPGNLFRPDQKIPREQVLVSLVSGLNYKPTNSQVINYYNDSSEISGYARDAIAAATEKNLVVNYPNLKFLNPSNNATRASVAAYIYQALANSGRLQALNSPYIVSLGTTQPPQPTSYVIASGTVLPVKYTKDKILVTADEKAPLTLTTDANVRASNGTILIPANTQVVGELQPATGGVTGSQFVAQKLIFPDGKEQTVSGISKPITKTETVKKGAKLSTVIKNTALGAGAAAAIAAVTGDRAIATEEVLGGAGIGALIGVFLGRQQVDLIVIEPDTDLDVTLSQDLTLSGK